MSYANNFPLYFAIISATMTLLLFWLNYRLDQNIFKLDRTAKFKRKMAFDLSLVIMVSGFIGGRALHIFYEEWFYYLIYPQEIFKFWKGGFVYYGGWISSLFCAWIFLRSKNQKLLPWADFFTPLLSLGYALGRVACYFEGCCYGTTRIPLQLIMVFCELVLFGIILFLELKKKFKTDGYLFFIWIVFHASTRFITEFYRADDRGQLIANILSVSQVISLMIVLSAAFVWVKYLKQK